MRDDDWQTSSFCGGGGNNCLQAARESRTVRLRESDAPGTTMSVASPVFAGLIGAVKAGTLGTVRR